MKNKSAIYKITNTLNGKFYVGSALYAGRRKIEHWRDLRRGVHGNPKMQAAWNKYSEAAFTFSILEWVPDAADLIQREQVWIDKLQAATVGYNILPRAGSGFGRKHSEETRKKMSESHKAQPPRSAEHRENLRRALKGQVISEEAREKMRQAKLGKKRGPHSEETRAKMSEAVRGQPKSDAHKAKLAAALSGRTRSPEAVAKFRATWEAKRLALSTSALTTEIESP